MAVHMKNNPQDSGSSSNEQVDTNAFSAALNSGQQQQPNQSQRQAASWLDGFTNHQREISLSPHGNALVNFHNAFQESMLRFKNTKYETIMLDNTSKDILIPLYIIAQKDNSTGNVAFYIYAIEAGIGPITPEIRKGNGMGRDISIDRVASDGINAHTIAIAREAVGLKFPKCNIHEANGLVVLRDADITKENVIDYIIRVGFTAMDACLMALSPDFKPFSFIPQIQKGLNSVNVTTIFKGVEGTIIDPLGQPTRSDVIVNTTEGGQQKQFSNIISLDQSQTMPFMSGRAYIDLLYINNLEIGKTGLLQPIVPRVMITDAETKIPSLELQLWCLVNTFGALIVNDQWQEAFKTKYANSQDVDLHDIGGIGVAIPFHLIANPQMFNSCVARNQPEGEYVDTKAATFGDNEFNNMMMYGVRNTPIFSMQISHMGSYAWRDNIYCRATGNDASAHEANATIMRAVDHMTGGAFSSIYVGNGRAVSFEQNLVHLGYWTDKKGNRRDVREIDFLAILNYFRTIDPRQAFEKALQYCRTFLDAGTSDIERLTERAQIVNQICNPTLTGRASIATFEPDFIKAFIQAISKVGITTHITNNEVRFNPNNIDTSWVQSNMYQGGVTGFNTAGFFNNRGPIGVNTGGVFGF